MLFRSPRGSKTFSAKTQKSLGDFNIFEGRTVTGIATNTISNGNLVYTKGDLRAVKGAGRYIKRPAFNTHFDALGKKAKLSQATAVSR